MRTIGTFIGCVHKNLIGKLPISQKILLKLAFSQVIKIKPFSSISTKIRFKN